MRVLVCIDRDCKLDLKLQIRVTNNPLAGEGEAEAELATCFDNPNHIELPSANQRSSGSSAIDTTTYCKKDKIARNNFAAKSSAIKPSAMITPTTAAITTVAPAITIARYE